MHSEGTNGSAHSILTSLPWTLCLPYLSPLGECFHPGVSSKYLTTCSQKDKKKYWIAVHADFCCANIPTMADLRLPIWNWEEMPTVNARKLELAPAHHHSYPLATLALVGPTLTTLQTKGWIPGPDVASPHAQFLCLRYWSKAGQFGLFKVFIRNLILES